MATSTDTPDSLTNLAGLKILGRIQPLFAHLHDQACNRDKAGNRTLHLDQLAALVMLAMFNPVARSLRALSQASDLEHVRKRFGLKHASLGSLSEAARVFDPQALGGVIAELTAQARGVQKDPRLAALKNPLTAVDGTLLKALPRMAQAAWVSTKDGRTLHAWRLHVHFEVDRSVPTRVELTGPSNSGDSDEKAVLRKAVEPGRCYVMDRWFGQFTLFNAIAAAGSDYVCRVRDNSRFEVLEPRPMTAEAIAAGVVSDSVVKLGRASATDLRPDHPTRLVVVRATPHEKRGGRKGKTAGPSCSGELLIATNLMDVPAEIIGLIYRYRWTIEIFFRFFKRTLGCGHLFWEHPRGIVLETYCAIAPM
ncbi:MAG: IS4-like element ISRba5 family transposase [Acidimicrobiales bacterium]